MKWIPCGAPGRDVLINPAHVVAMRIDERTDGGGWRSWVVELVMADGSTVQQSATGHSREYAQNELYALAERLRG